jgi:hypothetical protein
MQEEDNHTVVIETNTMFAVDVIINVKVRKTTSYGNTQPEYKCAEIARVSIPKDGMDWSTKDTIIKHIQREALERVKKHEEEIMKEE